MFFFFFFCITCGGLIANKSWDMINLIDTKGIIDSAFWPDCLSVSRLIPDLYVCGTNYFIFSVA